MKTLCLTIDLDRDVNDAVQGSTSAVSLDRGNGNSPRFSSTGKGTELLVELLDDLGIKATFFAEARALHRSGASNYLQGQEIGLHGLDHEDFSGLKTGIMLDEGDMRDIIERSISLIRDCTGSQPKGFRTPYMSVNEDLMAFLPQYGLKYDSSYYAYVNETMRPYRLDNGMVEIPVPKGNDSAGKTITSYLWPMHEGVRNPDDFIKFGNMIKDGVFVLATHSWHICESRKNGMMDDIEVKANLANVRKILESLSDNGFRIETMGKVALG